MLLDQKQKGNVERRKKLLNAVNAQSYWMASRQSQVQDGFGPQKKADFLNLMWAGVMIVTTAGYVSTAGEVQRKYSKSLLLLVVKLLLLVLVTTARRVSAVRV
ncbi:hypothetical protein Tco_0793112 [Tanacetum coccineum]